MSDFALRLNSVPYEGWEQINVSRSLERGSGTFQLTLSAFAPQQKNLLGDQMRPGAKAEVLIDGQMVLAGYVDQVSYDFDSTMSRITVSGRDRVADLIDCAASVDGPFEYSSAKLESILGSILDPYDIKLTLEADTGAVFKRIAIQPGESAFDFIERLCRFRSLLPISDGVGGLLLTKPGATRSKGALVYGQNILSASINLDHLDRFSLVVVKGQTEGSEDNTAGDVASGEGRATDKFVGRFRPKLLTAEGQGANLSLQERAKWQVSMARARSIRASFTVAGWMCDPEEETLWQVNTIVGVSSEAQGISRDMLVMGLTFSRSEQGTLTTLDLALPEAFDQPAQTGDEDLVGGL